MRRTVNVNKRDKNQDADTVPSTGTSQSIVNGRFMIIFVIIFIAMFSFWTIVSSIVRATGHVDGSRGGGGEGDVVVDGDGDR